MAEYIDRKALLESLRETEKKLSELYDTAGTQDMANSCYGQRIMLIECILRIKEQPTADVSPVRHGHWVYSITYRDADTCLCSECEQMMTTHHGERMPFCPGCGADMRGADNGE